jgi:probable phosphoglycerate mutase
LALEAAYRFRPQVLKIFMDSEVVIGQMQGRFGVHSAALKHWHSRACQLARRFRQVFYHYIPREANRLADALANEALVDGRGEARKRIVDSG